MSEPTKESLKEAKEFADSISDIFLSGDEEKLALKFDAIRREERVKAEKLAEALRKVGRSAP